MPKQNLLLNLSPTAPIGVFDSGVGGLSVLEVLKKSLPHENFVYFGDTANMPYGERSPEEITALVRSVLRFLTSEHQVKSFVVACNTSAGVLGPYWDQIGALEPVQPLATWLSQRACAEVAYRKIGLLATQTTINTQRYQSLILQANPQVEIQPVACTGLARLIEEGETHSAKSRVLIQGFLDPLVRWGAEAIILGCTHYPFAQGLIQSLLPESPDAQSVTLLDPALWMGEQLSSNLKVKQLLNPQRIEGQVQYFVSGDADSFNQTANSLPLHHLAHIVAHSINPACSVPV